MQKSTPKLLPLVDSLTSILHNCLTQWPIEENKLKQLIKLLEQLKTFCQNSRPQKKWLQDFQETLSRNADSQQVALLAAKGLRFCAEIRNQNTSEKKYSVSKKPRKVRAKQPVQSAGQKSQKTDSPPKSSSKAAGSIAKASPSNTQVTSMSSPQVLKGCGPKTAQRLFQKGLNTLGDLAFLTPVGYEDRRTNTPIETLEPGTQVSVTGRVQKVRWVGPPWRRRLQVVVSDDTGDLTLVWFRVPRGYDSKFESDMKIRASGRVSFYRGTLQIAHPEIDPPSGGPAIVSRYSQIEGISARALRGFCKQATNLVADTLDDGIPDKYLSPLGLPRLCSALCFVHEVPLHTPPSEIVELQQGDHAAQKRILFGELFLMQLELSRQRLRWQTLNAPECAIETNDFLALQEVFGFQLTRAQKRSVEEINQDLRSGRPMQRLLQGDVGSGKTAVAFAAAREVLRAGYQVALMAPTEILAQQHAKTFRRWLKNEPFHVILLTGSTPTQLKRTAQSLLSGEKPLLVIGTHALLSNPVIYGSLGLVIIDEQHRFGVEQRRHLREKGHLSGRAPHLLVMTATPIPRSLALTVFGDLDLSIIDEMPPGRNPASTRLYLYKDRKEGLENLKQLLSQGLSAYVVCPLVAESDKLGVADAERTAKRLKKRLPQYNVERIHGRLGSEEKQTILDRFRKGEIQILVATTVIEVGLDVPLAAIMMVINAERFGLAQLHQLRGRVGRTSSTPAHCLLMAGQKVGEESLERLRVLTKTTDGFRVAEADLQKRGPGEISGLRQSGLSQWPPALLKGDVKLLWAARQAATDIIQKDPNLKNPQHITLREILALRQKRFFGAESG